MSQDGNVLRMDREEEYEHNKIEWTVRFVYLMSGRLYSRNQVRDRISRLAALAAEKGISELYVITALFSSDVRAPWIVYETRRSPSISSRLKSHLKWRTSNYTEVDVRVLTAERHKDVANPLRLKMHDLSRHVKTIPVSKPLLHEDGLTIESDQPLRPDSDLILWKASQFNSFAPCTVTQQQGAAPEDAVAWIYGMKIPPQMLASMEKDRE